MTLHFESLPLSELEVEGVNQSLFDSYPTEFSLSEHFEEMAFTQYAAKFFDPETYQIITLPHHLLHDLKAICKIGQVTGQISQIYQDEYQELLNFLQTQDSTFLSRGAFMRLNYYSPKDSVHYRLPFYDWASIAKAICTSGRAYSSLVHSNGQQLILRPFNFDWQPAHEYRVFVYQNRLTAITQYYWHTDYHLSQLTKRQVAKLVEQITNFKHDILEAQLKLLDYVFDVQYDEQTVELVEINSPLYLAGTGCFNSLTERHKLLNETGMIYLKVCGS